NREVLREHVDEPAVDLAVPGDHAVSEDLPLLHAEVGAAMRLELVDLDERAGIEQHVDPLARRELARFVLLADPLLAATPVGFAAAASQLFEVLLDSHRIFGTPTRSSVIMLRSRPFQGSFVDAMLR